VNEIDEALHPSSLQEWASLIGGSPRPLCPRRGEKTKAEGAGV